MYLLAYAVSEEASVLEAQVYQSSKEIDLVYIIYVLVIRWSFVEHEHYILTLQRLMNHPP